ncbi:hypothetical protein N658DRAFT_158991 [Parathielavia hyrcaniae]|uniref:Uncharacterized protein n=1 Tax=Parathielavia hyrcaniae TaxID=113614 RepID=A0AAN6Q2D5_9PEZI|nr:hypothetical protein N658DRAFT_158991 [Parathielavia hyrcaniae]
MFGMALDECLLLGLRGVAEGLCDEKLGLRWGKGGMVTVLRWFIVSSGSVSSWRCGGRGAWVGLGWMMACSSWLIKVNIGLGAVGYWGHVGSEEHFFLGKLSRHSLGRLFVHSRFFGHTRTHTSVTWWMVDWPAWEISLLSLWHLYRRIYGVMLECDTLIHCTLFW